MRYRRRFKSVFIASRSIPQWLGDAQEFSISFSGEFGERSHCKRNSSRSARSMTMTMSICCRKASPVVALLLALMMPFAASGAERSKTKVLKPGEFNPADDSVDMFAAMKDGKIKVKLIAKDSTEANVLIENVSKKPLNVQLPE